MRYLLIIALAAASLTQLHAASNFYDDAGRLIRTIYPDGHATIYTYDDADNVLSVSSTTAPTAPTSIGAELDTTTSATISWEDTSDSETGYRIERRLASNYDWEVLVDLPANTTEYTDTTLLEGETYVYRVYALGASPLTSSYSAEATAAGESSIVFSIGSFEVEGSSYEIRFVADPSESYSLQRSTTLEPNSWSTIPFALAPDTTPGETELSGASGVALIYFPIPTDVRNFYRLVKN
ncbi:MAG: fibronectin type III domain-containing protein [Verrucomicrobiota bacterium]